MLELPSLVFSSTLLSSFSVLSLFLQQVQDNDLIAENYKESFKSITLIWLETNFDSFSKHLVFGYADLVILYYVYFVRDCLVLPLVNISFDHHASYDRSI